MAPVFQSLRRGLPHTLELLGANTGDLAGNYEVTLNIDKAFL